MTALPKEATIGVLGAGAMGSGIAQVAAMAGHQVMVTDVEAEALEKASVRLGKVLIKLVEKARMTAEEAEQLSQRITWAPGAAGEFAIFRHCDMVIEAVAEDLGVKKTAFRGLEDVVGDDCILATNTSSLSVTAIGGVCKRSGRVVGLHFFNPPSQLPLVEVVPGLTTSPNTLAIARDTVESWGKTPVTAADTPGFIVNRIARPFYGEALRIFEEGIADKPTIDWAMKEAGFKMGPFELMDMIGNDINLAVTTAIFEAFHYDPRYKPSVTQQRLVSANRLGWKTGLGHYEYRDEVVLPSPTRDPVVGKVVLDRILAMLINEAVDALFWRIASRDDIELAMSKGVNYPKGLLKWGDEIGLPIVLLRLTTLQEEYGEDRYRPSPLLRRMVRDGTRFYP